MWADGGSKSGGMETVFAVVPLRTRVPLGCSVEESRVPFLMFRSSSFAPGSLGGPFPCSHAQPFSNTCSPQY